MNPDEQKSQNIDHRKKKKRVNSRLKQIKNHAERNLTSKETQPEKLTRRRVIPFKSVTNQKNQEKVEKRAV